jgi:hypothetical protein
MKRTRLSLSVLLGGAVLVVLSCADPSPTAPAGPQGGLFDGLLQPTGLLACSPLAYDSVTQTVGPEGGTLFVGPHRLVVPAGALDAPVAITGIVRSETVNRIHFEPEGLVFNQYSAPSLWMSYANCSLLGSLLPKRIAYVTPDLLILEYLSSLDSFWTRTVRGKVPHFSDYAIAW